VSNFFYKNHLEFLQSHLTDNFAQYQKLSDIGNEYSEKIDICQRFLSLTVMEHPTITDFFQQDKGSQALKNQGSIYEAIPHHSLRANVSWMLANIHAGRSFVICSAVSDENLLSQRRGGGPLTGFGLEIGIAVKVGYEVTRQNDQLVLVSRLSPEESQMITYQDIHYTEAQMEDILSICHWVGDVQAKKIQLESPPEKFLLPKVQNHLATKPKQPESTSTTTSEGATTHKRVLESLLGPEELSTEHVQEMKAGLEKKTAKRLRTDTGEKKISKEKEKVEPSSDTPVSESPVTKEKSEEPTFVSSTPGSSSSSSS